MEFGKAWLLLNSHSPYLAGATFTCRVPSRPACPLPGRSSAGRAFFAPTSGKHLCASPFIAVFTLEISNCWITEIALFFFKEKCCVRCLSSLDGVRRERVNASVALAGLQIEGICKSLLGDSLRVEQRTLTPLVLVRIQVPQPNFLRYNHYDKQ